VPLTTATIAGASIALPYIFLIGVLNPRFLLPAYALLALPAALGLRALWPRAGSTAVRALTIGALLVPLLALAVWQVHVARVIDRGQVRLGDVSVALARSLRQEAHGQPCAFASVTSFPQIEFASGCDGIQLYLNRPSVVDALNARASTGERVFALSDLPIPAASPLTQWRAQTLAIPGGHQWVLYTPPTA